MVRSEGTLVSVLEKTMQYLPACRQLLWPNVVSEFIDGTLSLFFYQGSDTIFSASILKKWIPSAFHPDWSLSTSEFKAKN